MESMIVPSRSKRKVVRGTRGIYSYVEHHDRAFNWSAGGSGHGTAVAARSPHGSVHTPVGCVGAGVFRPRILSHGLYRGSRAAVHQGPAGVVAATRRTTLAAGDSVRPDNA